MEKYIVLNKKGFSDEKAKKRPQFWHDKKAVKMGDILTLNPDAFETKEYLSRGLIAPVKNTK